MKTQIVNIDPHDDYGSLRDKLLWTKSPRVILVWPGREEILSSKLDLVLLKRLAQHRGIAIGLLTFDPQVRALAAQLSLPIFDKLENLPESAWDVWQKDQEISRIQKPVPVLDRPDTRSNGISAPRNPFLRFLILLLPITAFIFALALLLPTANITLRPTTLRELETLQFSLEEDSPPGLLQLPYERRELVIEGEYRLPTSASIQTPDQAATGEVIFSNLTEESIFIPAGTVVRSSANNSIYFLTERDAHLAGERDVQTRVDITASTPGPDGNLESGAIDSIDGSLGLSVSVTNPEPVSGGSLQTRSGVSSSDVRNIQLLLEEQLKNTFLLQMAESLLESEEMLESTYRVIEISEQLYDAAPGDVADSLGLKMKQRAEISIISRQDIRRIAVAFLDDHLLTGYNFTPDSPQITSIQETVDELTGAIIVEVDLSVRTYYEIDIEEMRQAASGLTIDQFEAYLSITYSGDTAPLITIDPPWWPRLPFFEHQIDVSVDLEYGL